MKWFWRILIFVLLFSIGFVMMWMLEACCPKIARHNVTGYAIDKGECVYTPAGACLIPNDNTVDAAFLEEVDRKIVETENCVYKEFPQYKRLTCMECRYCFDEALYMKKASPFKGYGKSSAGKYPRRSLPPLDWTETTEV